LPPACAAIEQHMQERDFAPQTSIFREGQRGDAAFLIRAGLVAARRKDPDSGVEFLLSELGPRQMFGEMSLLTNKPRAASVVALELS
jgi:CRP-like cAMP-binding protein